MTLAGSLALQHVGIAAAESPGPGPRVVLTRIQSGARNSGMFWGQNIGLWVGGVVVKTAGAAGLFVPRPSPD